MFMKRITAIMLTLLLIVPLLAACGKKDPDIIHIGILQYFDHVALESARQGFIDGLAELGYVDGENIRIDYQNAANDASMLNLMAQKLVDDGNDLILGITTAASQALAAATTEIPILITAVTDPKSAGIIREYNAPGTNVTGTSDLTPVALQLEMLMELFPDTRTIGILYNSGEANSVFQAAIARDTLNAMGVAFIEGTVSGTVEVAQVTESVIGRVDAIYIPTCNTLASSIDIVTAIAYEAGKPVIAGDGGTVRAGALITKGINYYDLGWQTAVMAVQVLRGEGVPATMPIQYAAVSDTITVNTEAARRLGWEIPAHIRAAATLVP
jgi:putative ABC transport system substrate-binding protein